LSSFFVVGGERLFQASLFSSFALFTSYMVVPTVASFNRKLL